MGSIFSAALDRIAQRLDRSVGWDRLPRPIAIVTLVGLRDRLRQKNLYDTGKGGVAVPSAEDHQGYLTQRTLDGTFNDLEDPRMGAYHTRFGRNVPLAFTYPEPPEQLLDPNPRLVSRKLLTRDEFQPATTLNLLAAAWIQFEVHDWFSHGQGEEQDPWEIPLEEGDDWHESPMRILRAKRDPHPDPDGPPTYLTEDSHWWDASQIYGGDPRFAQALRADGGKLKIDEQGLPPPSVEALVDLAGVAGNFWIGLALLHSLFMREHNAIVDHLKAKHSDLGDEELYQKARLVNAALMAKIHTVDWTPAIIAHPTTVLALRANWYGLLGERFMNRFGRRTSNEVIRGIPGSPTSHHTAPYSLTEEFVAVYKMHPLIPDDYTFRSLENDSVLQERTLREVGALDVRARLDEMPMRDVFYSFGRMHPGAITLHNYPRFLQDFRRAKGDPIDLAAIDVLRTRERGVPRYNEFRRLFHRKPVKSFEELVGPDKPEWAEELKEVYGDVDRVDQMIGLFAEPKPKGFGFSDTAFRVFILMASRRLKSDRFFTRDYRPEIYTRAGIDWVEENTMRSLLLRHFPELEPALRGVANPFAPWRNVAG
jgi:Animal haem peroxidase